MRLIAGIVLALVAGVTYLCSSEYNPITDEDQRVALTAEQEVALGAQAAPVLAEQHGGLESSPQAQQRVDRICERLVQRTVVAESPYTFDCSVLGDETTVNAFALPGGRVFVTTGLVGRLESEAELAGILGHEIGHVVARHGAEHLAKQQLAQGLAGAAVIAAWDPSDPAGGQATAAIAQAVSQLVTMRFSREDELEADDLGVRFMAAADYDPAAMIRVMEVLAGEGGEMPEFFSTHPSPDRRIEHIRESIEAHSGNGGS